MINQHLLQKQKQKIVRRNKKILLFKHQQQQHQNYQVNIDPNKSYGKASRSKSLSKKSRQSRSLSNKQRLSKQSNFSSKDRKMTKQLSKQKEPKVNKIQYKMNQLQDDERINLLKRQDKIQSNNKQNKSNDKRQIQLKIQNLKHASSKSRNKLMKIHKKISLQKQINREKTKEQQQLQALRQQNQYVKIVYKSSLQKMKRLQNHLQNQKNQYQSERKEYQKRISQLKNKVKCQKKINLGHIYSYEDQSLLEVKPQSIILQTDREDSSYIQQSQKKQNPSKLSLHSKMYQN